ncbi:PucR family transcriptional regulator ligand-binding domain-containing protein [Actinomadura sediminis]|uniref:PucR family transcriptional regulator ligand-binding domain-containing protein n=1 Tax=Actinomadura sediminis TaxID=1038904 RepID=A0ABW3EVF6_9ACTN
MADVLDLPAARAGLPEVLTGAGRLDRSVRWVHVSDIPNVSEVLAGHGLVLTTGQAMAGSARSAVALVEQLAQASAAGLVVELGASYPRVQPEAVARAEELGLPLVCLHAQVRFVEVTEAAHRRLGDRLGLLRGVDQDATAGVGQVVGQPGAGQARVERDEHRAEGARANSVSRNAGWLGPQ